MALRTISICSGAGGLDLGLALADPAHVTLAHVEREVSAAAILASRMQDGCIPDAPIWSDLTTFDATPLRGLVDCVCGGLPCQPFSVAGSRLGDQDERFIWDELWRIIGECEPSEVFLENVPGLISTLTIHHRRDILQHLDALQRAAEDAPTARERWYLDRHRERLYRRLLKAHGVSALLFILCRLEELGFDATWGTFSATEVGAPHRRERVFIYGRRLAHTKRTRRPEAWIGCDIDTGLKPQKGCGELADATSARPQKRGYQRPDDGEKQPTVERDRLPLFPPGPTDLDAWRAILAARPDLAPAIKPGVRRMADGLASRVHRLRAIGNGVVPLAAALAYRALRNTIQE